MLGYVGFENEAMTSVKRGGKVTNISNDLLDYTRHMTSALNVLNTKADKINNADDDE